MHYQNLFAINRQPCQELSNLQRSSGKTGAGCRVTLSNSFYRPPKKLQEANVFSLVWPHMDLFKPANFTWVPPPPASPSSIYTHRNTQPPPQSPDPLDLFKLIRYVACASNYRHADGWPSTERPSCVLQLQPFLRFPKTPCSCLCVPMASEVTCALLTEAPWHSWTLFIVWCTRELSYYVQTQTVCGEGRFTHATGARHCLMAPWDVKGLHHIECHIVVKIKGFFFGKVLEKISLFARPRISTLVELCPVKATQNFMNSRKIGLFRGDADSLSVQLFLRMSRK